MLVTCPDCNKKLKVPESVSGKKVRCPGCKAVVAVPAHPVVAAPPPRPATVPQEVEELPVVEEGAGAAAPASTMRCAACKVAALQKLPPNQFSRHPGYVCSACGAIMRQPGTTGTYIFVTLVGVLMIPLAVVLAIFAFNAQYGGKRLLVFAGSLGLLGAAVAGWAGTQLRLPTPLDAPVRPSRLWIYLLAFLLGLLVLGGGLFGFMYFLHEM
jgi:hypothetical protein